MPNDLLPRGKLVKHAFVVAQEDGLSFYNWMNTKNVLNLTFTMTLLAFVGVHYLQPQIAMLQVRPASCQFRLLWCGRDPQ